MEIRNCVTLFFITNLLEYQEVCAKGQLTGETNEDLNPLMKLTNVKDQNNSSEHALSRMKRQYYDYNYDPYYYRRYPPYPLPIIVGLGGFGIGTGFGYGGRGFGGRGFGGRGFGGRGFGGRGFGGRGFGGRGIGGRGIGGLGGRGGIGGGHGRG
ncbi:uncharacterized protein LOC113512634 isoform X2 [Galleria mellonella]|uniref:Uncharacterized protein LOC113512634 isoform X2 n=1 Tax=Galleria mellonella TaxID=7137 RepID=A0ABM3N701_GALME|nr:uncharacterized protein LOC113512634 isoform X2 [Galleria mellonella]